MFQSCISVGFIIQIPSQLNKFLKRIDSCREKRDVKKCAEKARPQGSQRKRDRKAARKYRDSREKENCIVKIEQVYCVEGW